MGIFSKKKSKDEDMDLPDLPDLPPPKIKYGASKGLPAFEEEDEGHALPSFPDSPMHNKFSQAAIKDAVDEHDGGSVGASRGGKDIRVVEMEEWHHPEHEERHSQGYDYSGGQEEEDDEELAEPELKPAEPARKEPVRKMVRGEGAPDVFVKIDKFHSARRALDDIATRLDEIDEMVKKIREVKLREDQEFGKWEKDITHVKARISEVNDNIFEKVE